MDPSMLQQLLMQRALASNQQNDLGGAQPQLPDSGMSQGINGVAPQGSPISSMMGGVDPSMGMSPGYGGNPGAPGMGTGMPAPPQRMQPPAPPMGGGASYMPQDSANQKNYV